MRTLRQPLDVEVLRQEIQRYDAADAAEVSRRVRSEAGLDQLLDTTLAQYQSVLAEHRASPPIDFATERRDAAAYLAWLTSVRELIAFEKLAGEAAAERDHYKALLQHALAERDQALPQLDRARVEQRQSAATTAGLQQLLTEGQARVSRLEAELTEIRGARLWRWRDWLLGTPGLGKLLRRRQPRRAA
jgi:hypothetical protein